MIRLNLNGGQGEAISKMTACVDWLSRYLLISLRYRNAGLRRICKDFVFPQARLNLLLIRCIFTW